MLTMMVRAPRQDAAADGFPVLDLADHVRGVPGARERLADAFRTALETVGFLVVVNHGVPAAMIEDIFTQAARLHALPMARKLALRMGRGSVGYLAAGAYAIKTSDINDNRKPDLNEAFFIDRERSPDDPVAG
jgi:isopenicillin N synthase-like dioxygenase